MRNQKRRHTQQCQLCRSHLAGWLSAHLSHPSQVSTPSLQLVQPSAQGTHSLVAGSSA